MVVKLVGVRQSGYIEAREKGLPEVLRLRSRRGRPLPRRRKEGRTDGKNRAREAGAKEKERERERVRRKGCTHDPEPNRRGTQPPVQGCEASGERDVGERLEIERTKQGRKRGDYGWRGERYRIYEEENRESESESERKLETTPSRESTVPEINTPASCDHSSCHAPLLSPHISCLSRSLSFIPFSPSLSFSPSRSYFLLLCLLSPVSPFLTLRGPRSSSL